jgi:hypothetical protein
MSNQAGNTRGKLLAYPIPSATEKQMNGEADISAISKSHCG